MPVKIRLARRGRRKKPYYHIVVADARAPRDGRFIEQIGSYNPMTKPATIEVDRDKAVDWLQKGAQPTDTMRAILRFKGVLYRMHLLRGVNKGAMSIEDADTKWQAWIDEKEAKVAARREQVKQETEDFRKHVSGTAKKVVVAEPDTEAADAFRADDDSGSDKAPATEDSPTTEESPAVEETVAEDSPTTEESPAVEETVAEDSPAAEEVPAAETTVAEDSPTAEEVPAAEETSTEEAAVPAEAETTDGQTEVAEEVTATEESPATEEKQ